MAEYKCFKCGKVSTSKKLEKRFTCTNCDSKIFFKPRSAVVKVKTN